MSPLEVALTNKRLPEGGLNLLLHNLHLCICGIPGLTALMLYHIYSIRYWPSQPVETRYTDHLCDGEIASMIGCIAIPKWKSALLRFSRYTVMFLALFAAAMKSLAVSSSPSVNLAATSLDIRVASSKPYLSTKNPGTCAWRNAWFSLRVLLKGCPVDEMESPQSTSRLPRNV